MRKALFLGAAIDLGKQFGYLSKTFSVLDGSGVFLGIGIGVIDPGFSIPRPLHRRPV